MIKILAITNGFKYFKPVIDELSKRLDKFEIIQLKPSKFNETKKNIETDTENIIAKLNKFQNYYKILLDKNGKEINTLEFKEIFDKNTDILFIIGGAFGVDKEKLQKYIDLEISFGKITLSHLVAITVLIEQIYRIQSLQKGKKYHY